MFGVDSQDANQMLPELTLEDVDAEEHPLCAIFGRVLVAMVDYLPRLYGRGSDKVVMAGLAGTNILELFQILRKYFCDWRFACIARVICLRDELWPASSSSAHPKPIP